MKNGFKDCLVGFGKKRPVRKPFILRENFSEKEIRRLAAEMERFTGIISENPLLFPVTEKLGVGKVIILKYNTLYYKVIEENVYVVSFFSNRQNPEKRNFK